MAGVQRILTTNCFPFEFLKDQIASGRIKEGITNRRYLLSRCNSGTKPPHAAGTEKPNGSGSTVGSLNVP